MNQSKTPVKYYLKVICPNVKEDQELVVCGPSDLLGNWDAQKAPRMHNLDSNEWELILTSSTTKLAQQYRLGIYDKTEDKIIHWEQGFIRAVQPIPANDDILNQAPIIYRYDTQSWKAAGVAIPVFSLRSNDSSGIGEFSDLKKLIDWAYKTKQSLIQILPINDTTITRTWKDSYPYNAISIYALHPIYLGLHEFPLKNEELKEKYKEEAQKLNNLPDVDYDAVLALKTSYVKDLFTEIGQENLEDEEYLEFKQKNDEWLFPYACFSYIGDLNQCRNPTKWQKYQRFDKQEMEALANSDAEMKKTLDCIYFTQFLLHKQLVSVKEYANKKGVVLKGDIPIGISRNSVEAWAEPNLFNLDVQTGAPPDSFSVSGQNWGFPTYNWNEMEKNRYQWWVKRFRKMADYFDAYRIDHILGFFRIWEIPSHSVQGLLGYFSPALPLSIDEIQKTGLKFDEDRMLKPYIYREFISALFGDETEKIIEKYLEITDGECFGFKQEYDTQVKIKRQFAGCEDIESLKIRDALYNLCNQVLFIRDKKEQDRFHPRITGHETDSYKALSEDDKEAYDHLYKDFFHHRHSQFWRDEALKKLPVLLSATEMLACGEDLGMLMDMVPGVMRELEILSLRIERVARDDNEIFENMKNVPYRSVCTTSSHDVAPLRAWWLEDKTLTQKYYNEILGKEGSAPEECIPAICSQIISNHLNSPAMLAILPLQDWLAIDSDLRRKNPEEERINIPAIPRHYWKYRMHLTLEGLIEANQFNDRVRCFVEEAGRV